MLRGASPTWTPDSDDASMVRLSSAPPGWVQASTHTKRGEECAPASADDFFQESGVSSSKCLIFLLSIRERERFYFRSIS